MKQLSNIVAFPKVELIKNEENLSSKDPMHVLYVTVLSEIKRGGYVDGPGEFSCSESN